MNFGYDTLAFILIVWNVITFLIMGIDKRKAVKDKKRIRVNTLLMLAFFFGSIGILMGMVVFRHKIRKTLFLILVPVAIIINILMVVGVFTLVSV